MKQVFSAVLALILLVSMTACNEGTENSSVPPTAATTHTTQNFLGIRIEELLTKAQIEGAMGFAVREPEVKESGTQLYVLAADASCSIKLNAQVEERSRFDSTIASLPSPVAAPNLGEVAWWVAEYETLFVYAKGYSLNVIISGGDYDDDTRLMLSRGLALLALERL